MTAKPENPPAFPLEIRRVDWLPPDVAFVSIDGTLGNCVAIIENIGTGTPAMLTERTKP